MKKLSIICLLFELLTYLSSAWADGVVIDKIYDPYVELYEREVEIRSSFYQYDDDQPDFAIHRFGIGYGVTDNWFFEAYVSADKENDESMDIEAYELEAKWQLTEQGEYALDWGLLFEFENREDLDIFETSASLLTTYEFDRWSLTTNASLIFEWGGDVDEEFETALAAQLRYRNKPEFEYGIELYAGEDTRGVGPVIMGTERFAGRKNLYWEFGAVIGIEPGDNAETPALTVRGLIEFEF